jgi:hypothetical protein
MGVQAPSDEDAADLERDWTKAGAEHVFR